jgi:hypothetical protein
MRTITTYSKGAPFYNAFIRQAPSNEPMPSKCALGSVRRGSRGGAVDGCVGGEDSPDNRSAWGTNHDANKGVNSARGAS